MNRRNFLRLSSAAILPSLVRSAEAEPSFRAAVLGHTGRGDYGHGMERVFLNRPTIRLVAVADPDEAGRKKAGQRVGVSTLYADYHDLLREQKPDLVSICPRHSDQHFDMAIAALEIGAHLVMEKPFTLTLEQADTILSKASTSKCKVAVAHQMRMDPAVLKLEQAIKDGLIGELLEVHGWGKQDHRAGGEDLIVLGTHVFDFMRLFAGDAEWCHATVRTDGRPIQKNDGRLTGDNVGLVAGDEVVAGFGFSNGVSGRFVSRGKLREHTGAWGVELIGSKGSMRVNANLPPRIYKGRKNAWKESGRDEGWDLWDAIPATEWVPVNRAAELLNGWMVDDWLEAIARDRPPRCSGFNAMKSLEMIHGIYHAALRQERVPFPLQDRTHPLTRSS